MKVHVQQRSLRVSKVKVLSVMPTLMLRTDLLPRSISAVLRIMI